MLGLQTQTMWKIKSDCTVEIAKNFLLEDFIKSVKRTRILYIETELSPDIGHGFFEPIMLILCWCDFIGALYTGKGDWKDSSDRAEIFIKEVMNNINPKYAQSAKLLIKNYRHGSVHAYAPGGNFNILIDEPNSHLQQQHKPHVLKVNINNLIDDFEKSIEWFANNLTDSNNPDECGSLAAFNQARQSLLKYETE